MIPINLIILLLHISLLTILLLMIRTQAILELLQANISLLLVDADHFWARDPLPWLDQQVF